MANAGPIAVQRSVGKIILLSIVTAGIYGIVWTYKTFEEIKAHRGGEGMGGALGLVLSFVGIGIFILPNEIQKMYESDGQQSPVSAMSGFWAFLFVIPWYFKVQGALNRYWGSKGAPAA